MQLPSSSEGSKAVYKPSRNRQRPQVSEKANCSRVHLPVRRPFIPRSQYSDYSSQNGIFPSDTELSTLGGMQVLPSFLRDPTASISKMNSRMPSEFTITYIPGKKHMSGCRAKSQVVFREIEKPTKVNPPISALVLMNLPTVFSHYDLLIAPEKNTCTIPQLSYRIYYT